jgi:hypothetical protein
MGPIAEAQRRGGGGGGGGGAGSARASSGGGGARQGAQGAQVSNSRADVRTNDVRSTSVNNVSAERNVNVNVECSGRCGGWDHPVAAAAVVGGTIAAVGSAVATVPPNCVPVNYGGMVYQQCGTTWYAPQGSQYVVVNPPY